LGEARKMNSLAQREKTTWRKGAKQGSFYLPWESLGERWRREDPSKKTSRAKKK